MPDVNWCSEGPVTYILGASSATFTFVSGTLPQGISLNGNKIEGTLSPLAVGNTGSYTYQSSNSANPTTLNWTAQTINCSGVIESVTWCAGGPMWYILGGRDNNNDGGTLPSGVSLSTQGTVLQGSTSALQAGNTGQYFYTNSDGRRHRLDWTVGSACPPNTQINVVWCNDDQAVSYSMGTGGYHFVSGSLPQNLTKTNSNTITGSVSALASGTGTYTFIDGTTNEVFDLNWTVGNCDAVTNHDFCINRNINYILPGTSSGGSDYISGTLPPGLTASGGLVTGTISPLSQGNTGTLVYQTVTGIQTLNWTIVNCPPTEINVEWCAEEELSYWLGGPNNNYVNGSLPSGLVLNPNRNRIIGTPSLLSQGTGIYIYENDAGDWIQLNWTVKDCSDPNEPDYDQFLGNICVGQPVNIQLTPPATTASSYQYVSGGDAGLNLSSTGLLTGQVAATTPTPSGSSFTFSYNGVEGIASYTFIDCDTEECEIKLADQCPNVSWSIDLTGLALVFPIGHETSLPYDGDLNSNPLWNGDNTGPVGGTKQIHVIDVNQRICRLYFNVAQSSLCPGGTGDQCENVNFGSSVCAGSTYSFNLGAGATKVSGAGTITADGTWSGVAGAAGSSTTVLFTKGTIGNSTNCTATFVSKSCNTGPNNIRPVHFNF